MQVKRKIIFLLSSQVFIVFLSGCTVPEAQLRVAETPAPVVGRQNSSVVKRFQPPAEGQTAVESAIELSQKYAKLSEEAAKLRQNNQDLINENNQLRQQLATLDAKFKQTQKELSEANDLLIEMRIELNDWQANVLGFRDEMREAETAQLEALVKILKILGGEVTAESTQSENESPVTVSANQITQSENR